VEREGKGREEGRKGDLPDLDEDGDESRDGDEERGVRVEEEEEDDDLRDKVSDERAHGEAGETGVVLPEGDVRLEGKKLEEKMESGGQDGHSQEIDRGVGDQSEGEQGRG
jgi:hypothetical protein